MIIQMFVHSRGAGSLFNLDGHVEEATDVSSPYNSKASVRVGSDGNMYADDAINGGALNYVQIDTATDWIRPIQDPTTYYMRYKNVVGSTITTTPGAVNTPIALTTNRTFILQRTTLGLSSVTFDIDILDTDQSTILATGSYTLTCSNES
jgi:hypothetical protein